MDVFSLPPCQDWLWVHPLYLMDTGVFSLGVNWRGHDADHSLPSNVSVKNVYHYPLPHMPS
jgi:hypothetical protein